MMWCFYSLPDTSKNFKLCKAFSRLFDETIFFWDFSISSPPLFRGGILSYHPVRSLSTPFLYCSVEILFDHSPGRKKGILSVSRFIFILIWNGERGIWTLAPRERPTPLAGAPLQPLEYFSLLLNFILYQYKVVRHLTQMLLYISPFCLSTINYKFFSIASSIRRFTSSAISLERICRYSS